MRFNGAQFFATILSFSLLALPGFSVETAGAMDLCPAPAPKPFAGSFPKRSDDKDTEKTPDLNEELMGISTDIVNQELFSSEGAFFNFLKLIVEEINSAVEKYKIEHKLDPESISFVFKGGNVLRMVANKAFAILPEEASQLLKNRYEAYFKRSDSDFSIYINEKKLGEMNFKKVLADMTTMVNEVLNGIREQFNAEPQKYFDLFKNDIGSGGIRLEKYLKEASDLDGLKDRNNKFFNANFIQLQLLDYRANPAIMCPFNGQYDISLKVKDNVVNLAPLSEKPHWIVNTDNRGLEDRWLSDPTKKDKMNLGKSRVAIEYTYTKNGKIESKVFPGELIDISIIDNEDDTLEEFMQGYAKNVALYTLTYDEGKEQLTFRAHSIPYLARNLRSIIFDTFDRPWQSGPKYTKRINRVFFLSILELLGNYGLGSDAISDYVNEVRAKLLKPMGELYPLNQESERLGKSIQKAASKMAADWPLMKQSNAFWRDMARLINERLLTKPEEKDAEEIKNLIELINENLDTTEKLSTMPKAKFNIENLYRINMKEFI